MSAKRVNLVAQSSGIELMVVPIVGLLGLLLAFFALALYATDRISPRYLLYFGFAQFAMGSLIYLLVAINVVLSPIGCDALAGTLLFFGLAMMIIYVSERARRSRVNSIHRNSGVIKFWLFNAATKSRRHLALCIVCCWLICLTGWLICVFMGAQMTHPNARDMATVVGWMKNLKKGATLADVKSVFSESQGAFISEPPPGTSNPSKQLDVDIFFDSDGVRPLRLAAYFDGNDHYVGADITDPDGHRIHISPSD